MKSRARQFISFDLPKTAKGRKSVTSPAETVATFHISQKLKLCRVFYLLSAFIPYLLFAGNMLPHFHIPRAAGDSINFDAKLLRASSGECQTETGNEPVPRDRWSTSLPACRKSRSDTR
jgi:hypothetical protein